MSLDTFSSEFMMFFAICARSSLGLRAKLKHLNDAQTVGTASRVGGMNARNAKGRNNMERRARMESIMDSDEW